ncbi:hypothetical protein [Kitasatospora sp. NPDC086791]|uniref:hypothetical protein n=1 Tax=Kitasatospora sp. NPDC086791 TaxID=3155178 RepID=UPI00344A2A1D
MTADRFAAGSTAVRRDIAHGRVWTAMPYTVLADDGAGLTMTARPGIASLAPSSWTTSQRAGDDAARKRGIADLAAGHWALDHWVWRDTVVLSSFAAGEPYSVHDGGDYRRLAERTSNPDVLRRLARGEYPFVWHAIAANAAAPTDLLVALSARRNTTWNENHLLQLIAVHPALTGEALDGFVELLAVRLREGGRPYAAVLQLAGRPEPTAERLHWLAHLPGASARLRRGVTRALVARPDR